MTVDRAKRRKAVARWHRRVAILVGLWLVLLAVSGIFINHAHDWGFDHRPLPATLQQLVYGVSIENEYCGNVAAIGPDCSNVFARLPLPAGELLLGRDKLFLLDGTGQLVETLAAAHLGLNSLVAGLKLGSSIYLRDDQKIVRTEPDLMNWEVMEADAAVALDSNPWQQRVDTIDGLTWERLFLDLHAARFLGPAARFVNDLMAGLILLLALSGAWMWLLRRK